MRADVILLVEDEPVLRNCWASAWKRDEVVVEIHDIIFKMVDRPLMEMMARMSAQP